MVENFNTAANDMNHDLELIMQWAHDWRMPFIPDPLKRAVELIFSTKKTEVHCPVILFNNVPLKKQMNINIWELFFTQNFPFQLKKEQQFQKLERILVSKYLPNSKRIT